MLSLPPRRPFPFPAPALLSWPLRMKIALGAAQGLAYLHEDTEERFIFRDFKTSNVLLDKVSASQLSVTACHSNTAGQRVKQ